MQSAQSAARLHGSGKTVSEPVSGGQKNAVLKGGSGSVRIEASRARRAAQRLRRGAKEDETK